MLLYDTCVQALPLRRRLGDGGVQMFVACIITLLQWQPPASPSSTLAAAMSVPAQTSIPPQRRRCCLGQARTRWTLLLAHACARSSRCSSPSSGLAVMSSQDSAAGSRGAAADRVPDNWLHFANYVSGVFKREPSAATSHSAGAICVTTVGRDQQRGVVARRWLWPRSAPLPGARRVLSPSPGILMVPFRSVVAPLGVRDERARAARHPCGHRSRPDLVSVFGVFLPRQAVRGDPQRLHRRRARGRQRVRPRACLLLGDPPSVKPAIATPSSSEFVGWNEFFWPMVVNTTGAQMPIVNRPGRAFTNMYHIDYNPLCGVPSSILPILVIFDASASGGSMQAVVMGGMKGGRRKLRRGLRRRRDLGQCVRVRPPPCAPHGPLTRPAVPLLSQPPSRSGSGSPPAIARERHSPAPDVASAAPPA